MTPDYDSWPMRRLALAALALACAPTAAAADLNGISRELADSRLKVDRTAPRVTEITAYNRAATPFQGDKTGLRRSRPTTTACATRRRSASCSASAARVHFEVTRTLSTPQTIYELKAKLRPGRNVFTWLPPSRSDARTYLVRITAEDGAGNRRPTAPTTPARDAGSVGGRPRARRRRRLHGRELPRPEHGPARHRDRRDVAHPADVPRRPGGHADPQRHAHERRRQSTIR